MVKNSLLDSDLMQDTDLKIEVSFISRRKLLRELLLELQQKSDIVLNCDSDSPADSALISSQVKSLTLATVMASVSHLYGVSWTKDANKIYTLHGSSLSTLERSIVRFGDPSSVAVQAPDYAPDLGRQISPYLKGKRTPISALPIELQIRLRDWVEFRVAGRLVSSYSKVRSEAMDDYVLHFQSPKNEILSASNLPLVRLQIPGEINMGPGPDVLVLRSAVKVPGQDTSPTPPEVLVQGIN